MEAMTGMLYVAVLIARLVHFIRLRNPMIPEQAAGDQFNDHVVSTFPAVSLPNRS
jgi:hypothetical protein